VPLFFDTSTVSRNMALLRFIALFAVLLSFYSSQVVVAQFQQDYTKLVIHNGGTNPVTGYF
jgi:hypothetical protein